VHHDAVQEFEVRRACADDVGALVVLRAVMFTAMGTDPGGPDAPWRASAARWFADALAERDRFAAFVVDDPSGGGVVSGAAVVCDLRTPSPSHPDGLGAHLFNVCTLPGHEGRGYARACVSAVLDWVREATPAATVDLAATTAGSGIYRALGFTESDHPVMRLHLARGAGSEDVDGVDDPVDDAVQLGVGVGDRDVEQRG
jgi:GNAT superfamily N-acetyltransferase